MFGFQSFYAIFFVFLVFFVLTLKGTVKSRKEYCIWCFMLLFLMAGLRGDTVGGDLKRYLPEFYAVANSSFSRVFEEGYHEPGYVLFIKFLGMISSDSRSFLLGTSFVSLIGPFVLFKKCSTNIAVSVMLYYAMGYYTNTFNNVRQALALSIIFCVIPFLIERKFWKYLLGVILAATFHYSAIVMLVVYFLTDKPLNFKRWVIYAGTSFAFVSLFFFSAFQYVAEVFLMKYDPESLLENSEGSGLGLFAVYFLIFILLSLFYWRSNKRFNNESKSFLSLILLFQLLAAAIQLAAPIFHSMVRMTYFFFIPVVTLSIPFIHDLLKDKIMKSMLYFGAFFLALLYMGYVVYAEVPIEHTNSQATIPYVFINTEIF